MGEGSGISVGRGLTIAFFATIAAAGLQRLAPVEHLDLLAFDQLAPLLAAPPDDRVVVVEIDQQSLERHGRWPWPRDLHAALIAKLADAEPNVIVYDVLFAEPSNNDLRADAALVSAVADAGNVVLPVIAEPRARNQLPFEMLPFADLPTAAAALGHGHLDLDGDGRLRRLQLRAGIGEAYWPAMASAAHGLATGEPAAPSHEPGSGTEPVQLGWISDNEVLIPVPTGLFDQRFYSATDILTGPVQRDLAGTVVLVGITARGLSTWVDVGSGFTANLIAPIYFHALAVQKLLADKTLSMARNSTFASAILALGAFLP